MTPEERSTASEQYASRLRNVKGTFAAEGMTIISYTQRQLERIEKGQSNYHQVLQELRTKYEKRG